MTDQQTAVCHDGSGPFPGAAVPAWTSRRLWQVTVTELIVVVPSAGLIRIFERAGWATGVHWPAPYRPSRHRRGQSRARPPARPVPESATR